MRVFDCLFDFFTEVPLNFIMSEKNMQNKMNEHLSNTRLDIKAVLQRFEDMGVKIDRRFQRDFVKQTTDW